MELEPTTLSDVVRLIDEVLEQHYGLDPEPLLAAAGIDRNRPEVSGSRVSRTAVLRLWKLAAAQTGDPSIGLVVGSKVRPTTFYALGLAFMTSETLWESLTLLIRYYRVIATVPLELELVAADTTARLTIRYPDPDFVLEPIPFDSFIASIIGLCRIAATPAFAPREVRLEFPDNARGADYQAVFNAAVMFAAPENALVFDLAELQAPLPGRSIDLLVASDRVLDDYIAALSPDDVSTEVRKLLLGLLPNGKANQEEVSRRMHMSRSTLHRRLREENTNYKELLESTRRALAIEYVRDRKHSLNYIAFLLGFSDQSNFSRAFRRWTGKSPKAFRDPGGDGNKSAAAT